MYEMKQIFLLFVVASLATPDAANEEPSSFFHLASIARAVAVGDDAAITCASRFSVHGERAKECGAINPERPEKCCEGYTCSRTGRDGRFRCITLDSENDDVGTLIVDPNEDLNSTVDIVGNPDKCGGYRSNTVECGSRDNRHASFCCEGYKCHPDVTRINCVAASEEYEPLRTRPDNFVQELPIELKNKNITVVETVYSFTATGTMEVSMPQQAKKGDLLLIFIGGSAGSKKPANPENFDLILARGRADINLKAMCKWYEENDDVVKISGGRNTFVTLSAVRGVDRNKPVVDSTSTRESASGKDGKAIAPSAFGVEGGAKFAAFSFDDPHVAQLQTDGYETVLSTHTGNGDGMAVYVSSSESTGPTEEVFVAGNPQKGGGDEVTMAVTLRPDGGPYDEPPPRNESIYIRDERRGDY